MKQRFYSLVVDRSGAETVEYALVRGLILITAAMGIGAAGGSIHALWNVFATQIGLLIS